MTRRVVITGASGNVGTALLRRLAGHADLVGVARRRPPTVSPHDAAQWAQLDLSVSDAEDQLVPVLAGADAVVHLAWQIFSAPTVLQQGRDRDRDGNPDGRVLDPHRGECAAMRLGAVGRR
jgi:uncharacterized protein YbjT (DUF2867 family)